MRIWIFMLVITFGLGCNRKDTPTESNEITGDSRELVAAAFARIDPMQNSSFYNARRATIIKGQLDQENEPLAKLKLWFEYSQELLRAGKTPECLQEFVNANNYLNANKMQIDNDTRKYLYSIIGIANMRLGEQENCINQHNHESCIIPVSENGIHKLPSGSRSAISQYEIALKEFPDDLETKYLLNLAYMTLGEYPDKVPPAYRIDPSWFKNKVSMKPFKDIAPSLGINRRGLAGGAIMDDFTNDGWYDIVTTSWGPNDQMTFYLNNGDGTFSDKTKEFGLEGHKSGLNINQTDFNNDGWLDIYIMRGAWYFTQGEIPNTLLMNTGKNSFVDVTIPAGLMHHAPTQTSAWTDINLDGWLDLVVGNESSPILPYGIDLYINQKDGTFIHQSEAFGLNLNHFFKGCTATDINNDRYPDLYFSSLYAGNTLFVNQGAADKMGFKQATAPTNVSAPQGSFPCWSFDFDNDGNEDIFVSAYSFDGTPVTHWMESHTGKPNPKFLPKLYHNKGNLLFDEVGQKMGLNEVVFTMGCNFGDINVDGFLDFYLGTGNPLYQALVPNKMYLNMDGKRFEDVSYSGGFANIQKGHAVSFGDLDHDGDEDIYAVLGGSYEGDLFFNSLFENPNEPKNNWLVLKLAGTSANKAAIGARVTISVKEQGKERKIYRTVTSGASFGANSLNLEVGLRKATSINNVTVQWPCKDCPDQVFTEMEINKAYVLTQDHSTPAPMEYNKVTFKENDDHAHHMHH